MMTTRIPCESYQLRVVVDVYLVILLVFYTSQVVSRISEPSAVGLLFFLVAVTQPPFSHIDSRGKL